MPSTMYNVKTKTMKFKTTMLVALLVLGGTHAKAQLSKNPNKFLGNITTGYQIDYGNIKFADLWNQLTPENETKWGSIEGTRGQFNWGSVDAEYNYCKEHGFAFKFHTLVWGGQYPSWMNSLSKKEQLAAITEWFDAVAERYPDLEYIDVVNEALSGHNPAPFKDALGGDGESGYDWIVTAFNMARERWPKAVLIYNDFNTFQWDTDRYIDLIQKIKAAGAPVDAAGCQSHDLNDMSGDDFKKVLEKVHDGTGLPIFISEYDICKADDQIQLQRYKEQFPIMWEADYVAGVTLWGYIYGSTWVDDGNEKGASGLIKNGKDRPALTWLREYMQTDAAINAKSPLISSKGFAFVSASSSTTLIGNDVTIKGKAANDTLPVDNIQLFVDSTTLLASYDTSRFEFVWKPVKAGTYKFTMKAYSVSTTVYEKSCTVKACEPGKPYSGKMSVLPGVIEAENFDEGENEITYSDNELNNQGGKYRDTGVDIDSSPDDGFVVGWTNSGEWLEYTVNVEKEQVLTWTAIVSSGTTNSGFQMYLDDDDISGKIEVPKTGDDWNTYVEVKGRTKTALPAGEHKLRFVITGSSCNIDKVTFSVPVENEQLATPYSGKPASIPGTIQAENFDIGMEGVAYHDSEDANQGDANFRNATGVDVVKGNNGNALGYTVAGEWVTYTVNVAETKKYYWGAVVSSGVTGSGFTVFFDDQDITGKISVPRTGNNNWDTYKTIGGETSIELTEGVHTLKISIDGTNANIDKLIFKNEPVVGIASENAADFNGIYEVYSIMGVYQGTVNISNGDTSVMNGEYVKGIYILRKQGATESHRVMVY